ncbi:uncharacterized protein EI97DRAFT_500516 [Westerdykella ornata]|uniref:WD40 repeat-like protein n=1 Tax=Westerdykella ornata TaxID=318751 RepID=A0A6A6JNW2_WESOR|nr:uncharacterized protein EI97DRAFT_500516 [Westerdykella ornata]KAF2277588.1 hypothetical protein EI97DRAFT_500516 [Westerdykella ornata]
MEDSDIELESALVPGLATPPLSPSKSISTNGWASPETPASPRKARSCLFPRNAGAYWTLSLPSPAVKDKSFGHLASLEPLHCRFEPGQDYINRFNLRSANEPLDGTRLKYSPPSTHVANNEPTVSDETPNEPEATENSCSDLAAASETSIDGQDDHIDHARSASNANTTNIEKSPNKLKPLTIRLSGSPLRPGQWVARGGRLSRPAGLNLSPDRFISTRRTPISSSECLQLSKPLSRLTLEEGSLRRSRPSTDPFSRSSRRSGRLNDELRNARETHSVISGRVNPSRRRGPGGLRRSSYTAGVRQVSAGGVWTVGGPSAASDSMVGVPNGRGGVLGSGTTAPLHSSMFLSRSDPEAELEAHEGRIALAMDVDPTNRVLEHTLPTSRSYAATSAGSPFSSLGSSPRPIWRDSAWVREEHATVLDAPQLRDDYYCSVLAYSHTSKYLAVGLGNSVHLWSERKGVDTPDCLNELIVNSTPRAHHVTSLSFSSVPGGQAILAVGRADGRLALWTASDAEPRFNAEQPRPISCVSFRPTVVKRPSVRDNALTVPTEELLVGDDAGHVGGNDNVCFLFETKKITQRRPGSHEKPAVLDARDGLHGEKIWTVTPGRNNVLAIPPGRQKHRWELNAAVKAIAFCPWQRGLLAIGGGSNDRCIHFYHTISGACLATIDCAAQVTSLIWSTTRREIAATFGFAQPEHPYRIAVFAWPSCEQIGAVPWYDENRALYAIPYPGSPNTSRERGEDDVWSRRAAEEGCIVVAASDAAIRFHEIWSEDRGSLGAGTGSLGGSEILESLHGIEREGGQVIRGGVPSETPSRSHGWSYPLVSSQHFEGARESHNITHATDNHAANQICVTGGF